MPQLPDTTLDDWLAYLERIHGQAIDLGLDRLARVAEHLDLPLSRASGRRPFVITVAGTNGKGSTCETLRQLGLQAGARVGLYSSPHLHRFNERVVIDRDPVSDDALIQAFKQVEQARGDISLTYFEFTTLAAFVVFHQADLDLWVLEVGLGGRLDAVNLVDCDVAVLTTVDRDHQAFLGDDINIIGQEKAGIFRSGRPAVLGSNDLRPLWPAKPSASIALCIGSAMFTVCLTINCGGRAAVSVVGNFTRRCRSRIRQPHCRPSPCRRLNFLIRR